MTTLSVQREFDKNEDQDGLLEFISLAKQTVEFAKLADCRLVPFSSPNLPYYRSLDSSAKKKVLQGLRNFNEICQQVLADGKSLSDSAALTWYALRKFHFIFPSDLFQFIEKNHIVEIYDRDNVQIFRNFRFFDVTSYTLEDLLCRSWTDLFARADKEHTQSILDVCGKFYNKEVKTVTSLKHVGTHRILETDSPFSYKVDAVVDYLAPIYDKARIPQGFIAIESASLKGEIPKGEDAEKLLNAYYFRASSLSADFY